MSEWISVKDRLPAMVTAGKSVMVLVNTGKYRVAARLYSGPRWYSVPGDYALANVTHWMPLPDPPKEGE